MTLLYLLFFILFFIVGVLFVVFVAMQVIAVFTTHAPFVPIPKKLENKIIEHLDLNDSSILYDLGCGDGRVLVKAARAHQNILAIGIEIGFFPYLLAKWNSRKYKNIKIKREDIFKTKIEDATHIFLYLYPQVINKLIKNIEQQCKPGTIILSCDFELSRKKPTQIIKTQNASSSNRGKTLFIYTL